MTTQDLNWLNSQQTDVLRFITAGSVDDGKSTLIGRLLFDTKGVFIDQLAAINRSKYKRTEQDQPDLALLTDGLEAEREQGITIDVAYRYFATPKRKFIVADAPGHEQYTRNMITGASTAQAAIILIDASKIKHGQLLTQTRRHSVIAQLLGIEHIIVAVNKMDLVNWDQQVFVQIQQAYQELAQQVGIEQFHIIPVAALTGDNISTASAHTPWYNGPTLLHLLETLPTNTQPLAANAKLYVQWVIRHNGQAQDAFRGYAGQLLEGQLKVGDSISVWPSQVQATIKQLYRSGQAVSEVQAGDAITLELQENIDISRGDLITQAEIQVPLERKLEADICWLDTTPVKRARTYWLKQGTRLTQTKLTQIHHVRDIATLEPNQDKATLEMNDIARISLLARDPLIHLPYQQQKAIGAFILIDPSSNQTVAAGMLQ